MAAGRLGETQRSEQVEHGRDAPLTQARKDEKTMHFYRNESYYAEHKCSVWHVFDTLVPGCLGTDCEGFLRGIYPNLRTAPCRACGQGKNQNLCRLRDCNAWQTATADKIAQAHSLLAVRSKVGLTR
jgi:hypothetical protein